MRNVLKKSLTLVCLASTLVTGQAMAAETLFTNSSSTNKDYDRSGAKNMLKSMLSDLETKNTQITGATAMAAIAQTLFLRYCMKEEGWISMVLLGIIGTRRIGIITVHMFRKIRMIKNRVHHLGLEPINFGSTGL